MGCRHKLLLMVLVLMFSFSICQAANRKDEWKKPDFNFRTIKTILIDMSMDSDIKLDEFETRRLETFFENEFLKNERWLKSSFLFTTNNQLQERISNITGVNLKQLEVENRDRYQSMMDTYTPILVDAILHVKITVFGYDKRYVPEKVRTYKEYEEKEVEVTVKDEKGKWVTKKMRIREPVERTVVIPAYYETYGKAGLTFMLVHNKTNETLWLLLDMREALNKEPLALTGRIIERAAKRLAEV